MGGDSRLVSVGCWCLVALHKPFSLRSAWQAMSYLPIHVADGEN